MIKIDVLEEIKNIISKLDSLDDYRENLNEILSNQDLALSDLYHYIEFNKMDNKKCYRMIKELKQVLNTRRKCKQDIAVLDVFIAQKNRLNLKDNRRLLIADIHKHYKSVTKEYKNRVYTDEELEDLLVK